MIELGLDVSGFDPERDLVVLVTEFLQDFGGEVITTTPYKTGFLRDNWYATIGDGGGGAPGRGNPIGRVTAVVASYQLGDTITYSNGANYAGFVEFGTSHMAPRAWCRAAIDRAPDILEAAAARVQQ
ncbi:HK97 gp10 family phage protein [Bradyrhizobium sp. CCBAU 51753]|uniref:HK97 gp10 family phage protein n=1 Tax=Bradyrhizobium sp. CCBAU 51753 TaxID=1325100 RepID=UPI001889F971|nr:HK97 gp10 family phage protein [Bradyrhizobium sp. CCBAU 51753]QOZ25278.1 hypothetical protein XH93_18040 [Bradyrhizobium sp. CCBAU 51753]